MPVLCTSVFNDMRFVYTEVVRVMACRVSSTGEHQIQVLTVAGSIPVLAASFTRNRSASNA